MTTRLINAADSAIIRYLVVVTRFLFATFTDKTSERTAKINPAIASHQKITVEMSEKMIAANENCSSSLFALTSLILELIVFI